MKREVLNFLFIFCFVVFVYLVKGQKSQISPKLDFDAIEFKKTISVSTVPSIIPVKSNETNADAPFFNAGLSNNSAPKIHGVRITVDTGDTFKYKGIFQVESNESFEQKEGGKHTKQVGIHTDITFILTADGMDDGKRAKALQEDASVPIYKGRGVSTTRSPHWSPHFSKEHHSYGTSDRRGYPFNGVYHLQYTTFNPKRSGVYKIHGGEGNNKEDNVWHSYVPTSNTWTTERYLIEAYRTNTAKRLKDVGDKRPCLCDNLQNNRRKRRNVSSDSMPMNTVTEKRRKKQIEQPLSKK